MVTIEFPDKTESLGIISKFFVSTYAVPSEFQKKYEPTERNIVAEIVPFNKQDDLVDIQKSKSNLSQDAIYSSLYSIYKSYETTKCHFQPKA